MNQNEQIRINYLHPFHLVDPSPWPLLSSLSAWMTAIGAVCYMHHILYGGIILFLGILSIMISMFFWWKDVIREGTFLGYHTKTVQNLLREGIVLFIVSEIMFFFSFFWAFFSSCLSPVHEIGGRWPPFGMNILDPFAIPLSNTFILLLSGVTVTWGHHALLAGDRLNTSLGLLYTIFLGILFTIFQGYEYTHTQFQINDGIYASTLYVTTGFHGLHVLIGTCFILVMLVRHLNHHFTTKHHVGLEGAIWYWHFVDVVWLILYLFMYLWPAVHNPV